MPPKRKATDLDGSDDDEPQYGKQILPVANLPGDFNGEPEDGLQYLFTVRREFNRLPHITRVANPYELPPAPAPSQSPAAPRTSQLPSVEWRTSFEKHFLTLRNNLADAGTAPAGTSARAASASGRNLLPDRKDRECWWAFLAGRPSGEWDPPKRPKVDKTRRRQHGRDATHSADGWTPVQHSSAAVASYTGEQDAPQMWRPEQAVGGGAFAAPESYSVASKATTATPALLSKQEEEPVLLAPDISSTEFSAYKHIPPEPTPQLLDLIDHRYAVHILMYLTHWITLHLEHVTSQPALRDSKDSAEPARSPHPTALAHLRWAFVLLARVETVPSADETAQLRSLARACVALIKTPAARPAMAPDGTPAKDAAFVASCWMIVAAVAGVWAQRDLWLDAEDSLAVP